MLILSPGSLFGYSFFNTKRSSATLDLHAMKRILLSFAVLGVACFAVPLTGCSGTNSVSVTGTVTMDGQPLSDAEVVFEPYDQSKKGQGGDRARTDAQGKFEIKSDRRKLGLNPGKYKVYISKWVDKKTGEVPPPEEYEMKKMGNMLVNKVESKYSDRHLVPVLSADVKGNGDDFKFEVTSEKTAAPPPPKKK
jgi:hypothetical protein